MKCKVGDWDVVAWGGVPECNSHIHVVCFGWIWEEVELGECDYSCVVFDL